MKSSTVEPGQRGLKGDGVSTLNFRNNCRGSYSRCQCCSSGFDFPLWKLNKVNLMSRSKSVKLVKTEVMNVLIVVTPILTIG